MRKHLTRIAILAVCSLGFIGITGAAPASAGNCSASFNPAGPGGAWVWYDSGYLWQQSTLYNCTGITAVQFGRAPDKFSGLWSGLLDQSTGIAHESQNPPFPDSYIYNYVGTNHFAVNWGVAPWCIPGTTHGVTPWFAFRIKSGSTWGPWHAQVFFTTISIWC